MILAANISPPKKRGRKRKLDCNRAIAYVRVSTEEQANGPHAQRDAIERYAAAHGLTVGAWFEEHVSGAARLDERPELWRAIEEAKSSRATIFIVAKRDRLARDQFAIALLERELEANRIRVHSADGTSNGDGPEAKLLRSMLDAIAEYERALISARTKAALASRKRRGLRSAGSVPYGSRVAGDGVTLEDDPLEAPVAARVLAERRAGKTLQAITDGLTADGTPPRGERWHLTTVARLCKAAGL